MEATKQRNQGIDILKILSAFMIVLLHYLGYSDNLRSATASSQSLFYISNLIEAFCICGVNVFVIVSCYINIRSMKTEASSGLGRALHAWTQTIFITIPLGIILLITRLADFAISDVAQSVFPFSARAYWFVSAFICFSLLVPFLNRIIAKIEVRSLAAITAILVVVYSFIPTLFGFFGWKEVQNGYSLAWFVTLYFCTALLIKSKFEEKLSCRVSMLIYLLSSLTVFASVVVLQKFGVGVYETYIISNYASVPVLIQSLALVNIFTHINVHIKGAVPTKLVSFAAEGTLLSYVIHMHPMLKQIYVKHQISQYYPKQILPYLLLAIAFGIVICIVGAVVYRIIKRPVRAVSDYMMKLIKRIFKSA